MDSTNKISIKFKNKAKNYHVSFMLIADDFSFGTVHIIDYSSTETGDGMTILTLKSPKIDFCLIYKFIKALHNSRTI